MNAGSTDVVASSARRFNAPGPAVGVALGAGGARGLAHIVVLEALEELGVRAVAVSGSSMGAIVGAAWASGIRAADLRVHVLSIFGNKPLTIARLMRARVGKFTDFLTRFDSDPVLLDAELLLQLFWPPGMPDRFEDLEIPLAVVATNYHRRRLAIFESGPLAPPVAGSMAIPGLVKPVEIDGLVLVDGGLIDPLPYRALKDRADVIVACDVMGASATHQHKPPKPYAALIGAAQIVQYTITREMLKVDRPDILLRPPVGRFKALDFFLAAQILEAARGVKDDIKRGLDQRLGRL